MGMFQVIILAGILLSAQTTTAYTSEINLPAGQQTQNYRYSASGQLKADYAEGRFYTYYAGNGRVKGVYADDDYTTEPLASFSYDASGNRLCKTTYTSGDATERTWYLRDASGALLCYHKQDLVAPSTTEELPIPGVGTYLRSTTGHVPTHHFELVGIGKPLSCGAM